MSTWKLPATKEPKAQVDPGEPIYVEMSNYPQSGGTALHGDIRLGCCECGFMHHLALSIQPHAEHWYLQLRPYADDTTRPYKVIRQRPRRGRKKRNG